MFEFFLALFGGLYYGTKLHNEKQQLKKTNTQNNKMINDLNCDYESWMRSVTDEKLEYEVKNTAYSTIAEIHNRISNEAKIDSITPDMIIMGLLAQHGKIPKAIADRGLRSRGVWDYTEKLCWQEQRKFMLWYDQELRTHGVEEPLLFVDGVNEHSARFNISVATPVSKVTNVIGGIYFWKPMRKNLY